MTVLTDKIEAFLASCVTDPASLKKSDVVYYRPYETCSHLIRARIERAHRDGTVTVRAMFMSDGENDIGCFIGARYRHVNRYRFVRKAVGP